MIQLIQVLIFVITLVTTTNEAFASTESAQFSINLFQNGLPISGAEISIVSDQFGRPDARFIDSSATSYAWLAKDGTPITTGANGSIAGKLPPGAYQIRIRTQRSIFSFELPLRSAEDVQILVTFYDDPEKTLLNIESSEAGVLASTDKAPVAAEPAGEGTIVAQVISAETQKPIKDVQLFISGLNQRFRTDDQGRVQINIPIGAYSVSLLHSAYNSQTRDSVEINKDQLTELKFSLTPAGVELAEYVVLEPHLAGSLTAVIEEQKSSAEVATIMSAEQFSRSGDTDTASALGELLG